MRIFLCDLTHEGQERYASELVPYAIACLRSYLCQDVRDKFDVTIFKTVGDLDMACCAEPPEVIGFSNYMWNVNLSCRIAAELKARYPETFIIFGGPNFPLDEAHQERWLRERPYVDVYIQGEGEVALRSLLRVFDADGGCYAKEHGVRGTHCISNDRYIDCGFATPVDDLGEIPSPYLNGSLDRFLADSLLTPTMESNRGCPFTCTFCVDGIKQRGNVRKHDLARLRDELWYIAQRTEAKTLFLADTNFGMYKEDEEFSKIFPEVRKVYDFPHYVVASTGKNQKERVIRVAENMGGSLRVAASLQSMDADVLAKIKRTNIDHDQLADMAMALRGTDTNTYSELILGLPGDTREKHIKSILDLVDLGFDQIRMHQLTLLDGSEMATVDQRWEHRFETRHRILQRCFGRYMFMGKEIHAVESEEIVVGTKGFGWGDYDYCRTFALTVALFYNERIFCELAGFIEACGKSYSNFLLFLHDHLVGSLSYGPIAAEYTMFRRAAQEELKEDRSMVTEASEHDVNLMLEGELGNNLLFNAQGNAFYNFYHHLCVVAFEQAAKFTQGWTPYLSELLRYCLLKKGHLSRLLAVDEHSFDFDFIEQERTDWKVVPVPHQEKRLRFYYDDDQKKLFESLLYRFGTTPQGLGKLIARAPMRRTHRKVINVDLA